MIRPATQADLPRIAQIQAACPDAAQWLPLEYPTLVDEGPDGIRGFVSWRELPFGEIELLNLAVQPAHRRQGIARALVLRLFEMRPRVIYLEVREHASGARAFYQSLGFQEVGRRGQYYRHPPDAAVVMKLSSC